MIISDKYKCIFIRVPKTGSTSVEKMFLRFDPDCIISDDNKPPYGHFRASQLRNMVGEDKWNTYFKFGFFRDPKKWFLSGYSDNANYNYQCDQLNIIGLGTDGYLHKPDDKVLSVNDCITFYIMLRNWFLGPTQLTYLDEDINFMGTLENFENDIKHIFTTLKIDCNLDNTENKVLHTNKSMSEQLSLSEDSEKFLDLVLEKDIRFYHKLISERL